MSYRIAGRDECGDEIVIEGGFFSEDAAYARLPEAQEEYPECRLWVEVQKDKAYYQQEMMNRDPDDCYEDMF